MDWNSLSSILIVFHAADLLSYAVVMGISPAGQCPLYIIAHGNFLTQSDSSSCGGIGVLRSSSLFFKEMRMWSVSNVCSCQLSIMEVL
jgi:hypothetical protein